MRTIEIIKPGLFTTVQDLGRWGFQRFGMSVAGAMDHFALRVANLLVDANEDEAVLEITMMGPEIKFNCDEVIAVNVYKRQVRSSVFSYGKASMGRTYLHIKPGHGDALAHLVKGTSSRKHGKCAGKRLSLIHI